MKSVFVEGYGCSLNLGATEKIRGLLSGRFLLAEEPEKADFIVINTCAVKTPTENSMLRRIRELGRVADRNSSTLLVSGCLPLVSRGKILEAYPKAELFGVDLREIAAFFKVQFPESELEAENLRANKCVSIIPVARGCLGSCAYCCVKQARGELKSYRVGEIKKAFSKAVKETPEIWLTANDTGCFGFDTGTNLAELLESLLENDGEFRVRIGMMNPAHLKEFFPHLLRAMEDNRVYKFLHMPVQSGSDTVLEKMGRKYSVKEFESLVGLARGKFPDLTLSTDIIAGFPGETEADFKETLALVGRIEPDIVNVSRFGLRPNTVAALLPGKVHGRIAKERTRLLSRKIGEIALKRNRRFVGREQAILVSEKGKKGGFVGRNSSYKPVVVKSACLNGFRTVRIEKAFPSYLLGSNQKLDF